MYLTRYRFTVISIVLAIVFACSTVNAYNVGEIQGAKSCATFTEAPYLGRVVFADASIDPSMGMALATPAPTPIPDTADPASVVGLVLKGIDLVRGGGPGATIGIGLLLMVAVYAARKVAPQFVPKDYTAVFLLGTTALGGFASAIAAGLPVVDSALSFLLLGAAAIGFWEGGLKLLLKRWKGTDEKPALRGGS